MYDTSNITVVGNALNTPEWRRFERTNALVANFKIASTARRFDKNANRWIDGDNLRVRVSCWRRLAEGVVASIRVGDPVVVTGRLYTRDWTTESGERRSTYELEASSVGHDLSRGIAAFRRGRINVNTTVIEDAESDRHVKGEPTEAAPEENARSEAAAIGLHEELRKSGNDFPNVGYDGPVNTENVSMNDLNNLATREMHAELSGLISRAQETFAPGGATTGTGIAAAASRSGTINPPRPSSDEADEADEEADDENENTDESASLVVPADVSADVPADVPADSPVVGPGELPVRNRRPRQKVGAGA